MAKPWELRWNTGSPARPPRPPLLAAPDSRCSERSLGRPAGATEGRGQGKHASWKPKHSVTAGLGSPPSPLLAHSPALPWPSVPKKPFQSLIITHDTTARAAGLEAAGKTVQKVLCERGNSLMNNRAGRRKSWRLESLFLRRRCFLPTLYLCFLFRFPLFAFNVVSSSSCTSCDFSCSSEVKTHNFLSTGHQARPAIILLCCSHKPPALASLVTEDLTSMYVLLNCTLSTLLSHSHITTLRLLHSMTTS